MVESAPSLPSFDRVYVYRIETKTKLRKNGKFSIKVGKLSKKKTMRKKWQNLVKKWGLFSRKCLMVSENKKKTRIPWHPFQFVRAHHRECRSPVQSKYVSALILAFCWPKTAYSEMDSTKRFHRDVSWFSPAKVATRPLTLVRVLPFLMVIAFCSLIASGEDWVRDPTTPRWCCPGDEIMAFCLLRYYSIKYPTKFTRCQKNNSVVRRVLSG